jgi:methyltransferase (TIGR00027 family)
MTEGALDAIAKTATATAAARAVESRRIPRLFDDPWAARLAGEPAIERALALGEARLATLAIRTRWFDDRILAADRTTVLALGAGLDTRAARLPRRPGVTYVEVDRPEILAQRRAIVPQDPRDRTIAGDLRAADVRRAIAGVVSERTLVVAEGLLPYLEPAFAEDLFGDLAGRGAEILCDLPNVAAGAKAGPLAAHHARLAESGAPWRLAHDDPRALFARFGLDATIVHVGHPEAHYGRAIDPPSESIAPGAPALLLIHARARGCDR